jgi:hypothetical protein
MSLSKELSMRTFESKEAGLAQSYMKSYIQPRNDRSIVSKHSYEKSETDQSSSGYILLQSVQAHRNTISGLCCTDEGFLVSTSLDHYLKVRFFDLVLELFRKSSKQKSNVFSKRFLPAYLSLFRERICLSWK